MTTQNSLTTVNATGVAFADYDSICFNVSVEVKGEDSASADAKLDRFIGAINATIDAFEKSGGHVDRKTLRAVPDIAPNTYNDRETGEEVTKGYNGTYQLTFWSDSIGRAGKLKSEFTAIDGVSVSVTSKVKDPAPVQKAAFRAAKAKVDQRFADECDVLGLNPANYSWTYETRYDESEGSSNEGARTYAASAKRGGGSSTEEIHTGQARVAVSITVTYTPKSARARRSAAKAAKQETSPTSSNDGPTAKRIVRTSIDRY